MIDVAKIRTRYEMMGKVKKRYAVADVIRYGTTGNDRYEIRKRYEVMDEIGLEKTGNADVIRYVTARNDRCDKTRNETK